ncbi:hypothetical protein [Gordonia sp. NPDC003376]
MFTILATDVPDTAHAAQLPVAHAPSDPAVQLTMHNATVIVRHIVDAPSFIR